MFENQTLESVKDYYGKVLKTNDDLKTSACCTAESVPTYLRPILKEIHAEVVERFYGCGSPLPLALEGKTVLDLGSGSGRDVFVLSKLVGETGKVIGIDMTEEQLDIARKHIDYHTSAFGYKTSNVEFKRGYIEDLESAGIANDSIDVVVSNCVLNLSPAKDRVFSEIFRVLKPGGEIYFSDVFAAQRIPKELFSDPVLLGECLSGAMYIEDFRRLVQKLGCADYRVMSSRPLSIDDPQVHNKIGMIDFYSMTIRAFKLDLEDRCEDYGQVAYYKGTIENAPHEYRLDDHHLFKSGKPMPVCGNTADMLTNTRLTKHFKVIGEKTTHFGLFDCTTGPALSTNEPPAGACC